MTNLRAGRVRSALLDHHSRRCRTEHTHTTDDVFKSTVHRAVNRSGVARYSIPLFFGTDYDVPLEVSMDVKLVFYAFVDSVNQPRRYLAACPTTFRLNTKL